MLNNPLKYTDPSGHCEEYGYGESDYQRCTDARRTVEDEYGIMLAYRESWYIEALETLRDSLYAFRNAIGRNAYNQYIIGWGNNRLTIEIWPRVYSVYDEPNHTINLNLGARREDASSYKSHITVIHELVHVLIYQMYHKAESKDPASLRYAADMKWLPVGDRWLPSRNSTAYGRQQKSPEEDLAEALAIYIWDTHLQRPPSLTNAQQGWAGSFLWTMKNGTTRWWEMPKKGLKR